MLFSVLKTREGFSFHLGTTHYLIHDAESSLQSAVWLRQIRYRDQVSYSYLRLQHRGIFNIHHRINPNQE